VDLFRRLGDRVDVVLLDMTMPVLDGEATLRELKSIRPEVRVILSSGYNEAEAVRRFSGTGLAGFIQKPYTSSRLADIIRRTLENGHTLRTRA
jgi:DNA-binding NtrC family response regulator